MCGMPSGAIGGTIGAGIGGPYGNCGDSGSWLGIGACGYESVNIYKISNHYLQDMLIKQRVMVLKFDLQSLAVSKSIAVIPTLTSETALLNLYHLV